MAASTPRTCATRPRIWSRRSTRPSRSARPADVPVVISHHKASGTPNHGLVEDTLKLIDEARKRQKLGLDVYPYVAASTMLDPRRHSARQQDHRHLVEGAAGIRRTDARRHRRASSAATSRRCREQAAAGRRDLFHDERGRRAPRAVLSAHHDRLRRTAARRASASAAVGHLPARARALRARREAVPARGGGAADDRAAGGAVRAHGSRQVAAPAPSPIWCCSIRRRSRTPRPSTKPKTPAAGIAW